MSDGVIDLNYTPEKRSLLVSKLRGSDFTRGYHDLRLSDRGMEVYPRLIAKTYHQNFMGEKQREIQRLRSICII